MESFQMARDNSTISLSPNFILPEKNRPKLSHVSTLASIPIIDLSIGHNSQEGPSLLVQKISQACEEYGFFQIINHGVPQELCERTLNAIADFFSLPPQERSKFLTTDHTKQVKIINFYLKFPCQENVTMWSETFRHPWDPAGDFATLLPENPPQYCEVFVDYAKEMSKLMKRLFGLISQGLGPGKDCLQNKLGENPSMNAHANFYPPCPDPELTLGLAVHTDLNALTILMQSEEVSGLQVIKDRNWVAVDPVPNAFVVNLGDQLQVLSNGRYKSVHHRAITNKMQQRISLALFYAPNKDSLIGHIEDLIDEEHPPLYRRYTYAEFIEEFQRQEGTRRMVKEVFELRRDGQEIRPSTIPFDY